MSKFRYKWGAQKKKKKEKKKENKWNRFKIYENF